MGHEWRAAGCLIHPHISKHGAGPDIQRAATGIRIGIRACVTESVMLSLGEVRVRKAELVEFGKEDVAFFAC